ncbi:hypothetical protein [Streptomyces sp. NPDC059538]|uniref:hypothetical protein n=1 Tax=Streptomyces sp. NPDC059538 TaxID=3346860 RepID=UPI0036795179
MAAIDVNVAGTRTVRDAAAASDRVRRMVFVSGWCSCRPPASTATEVPRRLTSRTC